MIARRFLACAILVLVFANGAHAARYQRTKDGKTIVWNSLRGVAQDVTWSGLRDTNGYATGEGTLTWYRLGGVINSYTGKMVRGKFEGPVIREQGNTRLQATFANGEKVSNWIEPGSGANETPTPTPKPKQQPSAEPTETEPIETVPFETPTPLPSPSRTPLPTAMPTLRPMATPTPTPVPRSSMTPIPAPTLTSTPTAIPITSPPVLRSFSPSPSPEPSAEKKFRLEEIVEGVPQDSLRLATSPSPSRDQLEEVPWSEPSPSAMARISPPASTSPRAAARTSPTPISKEADDAKHRAIAEFKQQTETVLAQAADATGNFREIDDFANVRALPTPVTAKITLLTNEASAFRSKVGYETAIYECLAQIETVEALIIVDQITRDLAAKDAPAARRKLSNFLERYSRPSTDNEKALWRYLTSALAVGNRAKDEAEGRLKQARSLEAAGKKSEALREYQEIYRIYPNHITAEAIKALQNQH